MANQNFAAGDVNNEANTGNVNQLGTYRDPLSGVRETALTEPAADALVRLGWVKTDKDDNVVSSRDQLISALDLNDSDVSLRGDNGDQSGNSSQETIDAARQAALEQSQSNTKKDGK